MPQGIPANRINQRIEKSRELLQNQAIIDTTAALQNVTFLKFLEVYKAKVEDSYQITGLVVELANWLESTEGSSHRLMMLYRSFGKTLLASLYLAWRLMKDPNMTIIIFGSTGAHTKTTSMMTQQVLEKHPLTRHLIPNLGHKQKKHWGLTEFRVNRWMTKKEYSVVTKTAGGQKTGFHADFVLVDDIETADNCKTADARKGIYDTYMELQAIADKEQLFIGTPHDTETIYSKMIENGRFEIFKRPIIVNGIPTQPERHSLEDIETMRSSMTLAKWNSQYLLVPDTMTESQFYINLFKTYTGHLKHSQTAFYNYNLDKLEYNKLVIDGKLIKKMVAFWDPASGMKGRDSSVLAIGAITEQQEAYIIDIITLPALDDRGPSSWGPQFKAVLAALKSNFCNVVYVESNFNRTLGNDLKAYVAGKGYKIAVHSKAATRHFSKKDRIESTLPILLGSGRIFVREEHIEPVHPFRRELDEWPVGKHDDHLDAVSGVLIELKAVNINASNAKPLAPWTPGGSKGFVQINNYA